jgi:hypothetical protein
MPYRALTIVVIVAGACGSPEQPIQNTSRVAHRPGQISLASVEDFDIGVRIAGRDCSLPAAVRRLGAAVVLDCGRFNLKGVYDSAPKPLLAARACATNALASQEPFVLIWHNSGADPICDDMALMRGVNSKCGYMVETWTRALIGIRARDGYATYSIESSRGWSENPTLPGQVAQLSTHAVYEVKRCAPIVPVTGAECDGIHLEYCYFCEDSEETAGCQSSP